ncbi:MAG: oligopeptide transporter, OPT family [Calditrichaeota bacterium]|nr:MAG: oligopeptide transporter, OPT family [Calditrichota bacterium]
MNSSKSEKSYVPEQTTLAEFTLKALLLGIAMAVVLGAANAYLGLKAGLTVSATFPAAVIAIAAFRLPFFRGTVLEQNIARTAASVGEALVAGAIFTIPAFVLVEMDGKRLWTHFNYWETSVILLVGGVLGVLFVILLRRTLVVDAGLPFPESYACYEIVRAGQKGETGARYVFGAMGLGALLELLKNSNGLAIFRESMSVFLKFPRSVIHHFSSTRQPLGDIVHTGGLTFATPLASPALMGVGYIIGPRLAAINFCGGVLAWLVFIPLALFLNPDLRNQLSLAGAPVPWSELTYSIWYNQIRPVAVGAMLVGSLYTLWGLRNSIYSAFRGAFRTRREQTPAQVKENRLEKDINLQWIIISTIALIVPMTLVYYYFSGSFWGALVAAVIMLITGFLFAGVGGWLVGLVGGSNQPISGLALSTLIVAAIVMVAIGVVGLSGVAAVLAVAAVVCCATAMAGDMIQDLKVGQLLGGTPWKMEVAEIISTVVVSFVLIFPIIILHEGNIAAGGIGIGDTRLPAPQAGLMAQLAKGIVGGEMAWGLILIGMFFSLALILIKAPAPMLIAVGMYLPFDTTFAIFIGGLMKGAFDKILAARQVQPEEKIRLENMGTLVASGFIAGEALVGVLLAGLVLAGIPSITYLLTGQEELAVLHTWGGWLSIIIFAVVAWGLIMFPIRGRQTNT